MPDHRHVVSALQTVVVAILLLAPLWDRHGILQLAQRPTTEWRTGYYRRSILLQWALAIAAVLLTGYAALRPIHPGPTDLRWLLGSLTMRSVASAIAAGFFVLALLPAIRSAGSESLRQKYAAAYRRASPTICALLPATAIERRWFAMLSITAGICEEVLGRGFLFFYLRHGHLHFGWTATLLLSSIVFGWNHLYQGTGGVIGSAVAGFAFGVVFLLSGNLILPILLHAAVDLQAALVLRPGPAQPKPV